MAPKGLYEKGRGDGVVLLQPRPGQHSNRHNRGQQRARTDELNFSRINKIDRGQTQLSVEKRGVRIRRG